MKTALSVLAVTFGIASSIAQDARLDLSNLNSSAVVRPIPCDEEDCCERRDTFFVETLQATIYSFYRSGIPCDGYLKQSLLEHRKRR